MQIFKREPEKPDTPKEIKELREALLKAHLPEAADKIAFKELSRISKVNPSSAEYTIGINYIDYLTSLPWNRLTEDNLDIQRAGMVLDEAHLGLAEIKERIREHLAVRILKLSRPFSILVVDDEAMTRNNLEHVFTKEGYQVETAASGPEAADRLEKREFDVVVTDLKMEKVDGIHILEKAKALNPSTAVVIITGYATIPVAIDAMKKGSYHFIAKPFKLDEIRSTIQKALEKKKTQLEPKGPIICFTGPPGTGKTSLGRSIADSLERSFIRISLAGMKDEAEIRGHRRSYVGALPGRIIQEIRRVGYRNPVIMLDEIDKIGQDFKGDPASALLEVLDPEQNATFIDHYLDIPFDLSKVMFIATANSMDPIPGPLLDRLEVITLSGYSDEEKEQIAERYLIPRELQEAGLTEALVDFSTEAVQRIIREYTQEAGLRNLKRQIAAVCRKQARMILEKNSPAEKTTVTEEMVETLLGPPKFRFEVADAKERIGVTTGLAWTESGGQIIYVEATKMSGSGQLILTGSLGDVMKESAQAALSYIRSHTEELEIEESFFQTNDLHIHVPAGAVPKDGPSAGLTIALALVSLLTGRPARRTIASTGELTLSGRILPVGGIKEKMLAAKRAGVQTVIIPRKNQADLAGLNPEMIQPLQVKMVDELEEVFADNLI